jgi:signal transduction histidine kinase
MARADGTHPPPGAVEILRADDGSGPFRGRRLRISTDSPLEFTPQLAEVEVYQTRTPLLVTARADGHELRLADGLDVPPGVRRLSFDLHIPQAGRPAGDLFRWRIRGEMENWESSRLWSIDLACPPAGKNVFEAQALHSDGEWDSTIYQIPILVRQHWWKSGWFRWTSVLFMTGLAIGSGMLWSRRRAARQLARMKAETALATERARIARDMHDEVGGKLARLAMLGDLALHHQQTPTEDAAPPLATITRGVREVAAELEQVIWSLNPKHDCVEDLARHIYQYAEEFFADTPVHCSFGSMAGIPSDVSLAPETRNALFRSFKEAVANILKHAQATAAEIDFRYTDGLIEIRIHDNGRGFAPTATPTTGEHNGLANMHERMASIGGTCAIDSGPHGTTVLLRWQGNG